jgi:hypothetical protein
MEDETMRRRETVVDVDDENDSASQWKRKSFILEKPKIHTDHLLCWL